VVKAKKIQKTGNNTGANVGYEAQLWQMADALRGSMDAVLEVWDKLKAQ